MRLEPGQDLPRRVSGWYCAMESAVLIRQVRPSDAPSMGDGFARLSARSRRMRFL
jgi:hypothetical protein